MANTRVSNTRSNLAITLISTNLSMVIGFVSSLFIARLLTPLEIGIFSIAYVFAGLLKSIREMGLGAYLIQEKELTHDRIKTAFGISLVIALITAATLASIASYIGEFYDEPGITQAINVIALSFLIVPFGAISMSMLYRRMQFKQIAIIDIGSSLALNLTTVYLAYDGYGFMSLVWGTIAGVSVSVVGALYFRPGELPWTPSIKEWRRVISFSGYISASSFVTYFNSSISDILLGKLVNIEAAAYFNRANGITNLFSTIIMTAVNRVSLPKLSDDNRSGIDITSYFYKACSMIATLSFPTFCFIAITAEPLVLTLFGDQWLQSITPLRLICVAGAIGSIESMARPAMTALGAVRHQFRDDVLLLLARVALVIIAAPYGLAAVAAIYSLFSMVSVIIRFRTLQRNSNVKTQVTVQWIARALPICITVALSCFITLILTKNLPASVALASCTLVSFIAWALTVIFTQTPISQEVQLMLTNFTPSKAHTKHSVHHKQD